MLDESTYTVRRNTEASLEASRELGMEVSTKKTKHMFMSAQQNAEEDHNIVIADKSCENMAKFEYFGTRVTNQNCAREEIKVKVRVKLPLCLTKHHAMKRY
jgi:hypothetical protein